MHPREEPIHIVQLALVDVLVNKQWRRRPVVYHRPDFPPIGASALGKHKNQGPAIVTEIRAVRGRHRANIILICVLQVTDASSVECCWSSLSSYIKAAEKSCC